MCVCVCVKLCGKSLIYSTFHLFSSYIYIYIYIYTCVCVCVCVCDENKWKYIRGAFNKFPDFFVQAFKIVVDS